MSTEKKEFNIWTFIGRLSTIVSISWIAFQAFKFVSNSDLKVKTSANYYYYSIDPENTKVVNSYKLLEIANRYNASVSLKNIDAYRKEYGFMLELLPSYNTVWVFSIKNEASKALEELFLEMPNSGTYRFSSSEGLSKNESFKNRINLGNLKPSHSLSIVVWTNESSSDKDSYDLDSFEERVRFTHKEGAIPIKIPIEDNYFWAWVVKNDYFPLLIIFFVVITSLFLTFNAGYKFGPKIHELEMKTKLSELKALEEWKQKNKDSIKELKESKSDDKTET